MSNYQLCSDCSKKCRRTLNMCPHCFPTTKPRAKVAKPRVWFDGQESVVRSSKIAIPDLKAMSRFDALQWLIRNTYPRGYSRATNPLAGIGNAIKVLS